MTRDLPQHALRGGGSRRRQPFADVEAVADECHYIERLPARHIWKEIDHSIAHPVSAVRFSATLANAASSPTGSSGACPTTL